MGYCMYLENSTWCVACFFRWCWYQALADSLSKGRHYVFPDERGSTALDPRLLLVEFNSSILLHQSQVRCGVPWCGAVRCKDVVCVVRCLLWLFDSVAE